MPAMSRIERAFCQSAVWLPISTRLVGWSSSDQPLGSDVLEIGAGTGAMAAELLKKNPSATLTVTDIDPLMVDEAATRLAGFGDRAHVQAADVTALPFGDNSFDNVVSFLMLHHVIEWRAALAEIARVLRPGGTLLGYDLTRAPIPSIIHRYDGSPHALITADEFSEGAAATGLERIEVTSALAGQAMRFVAQR